MDVVEARGAELKRLMDEVRVVRLALSCAADTLAASAVELERIERVLWAIGADLDGRP